MRPQPTLLRTGRRCAHLVAGVLAIVSVAAARAPRTSAESMCSYDVASAFPPGTDAVVVDESHGRRGFDAVRADAGDIVTGFERAYLGNDRRKKP
jgi:hypothetical protein